MGGLDSCYIFILNIYFLMFQARNFLRMYRFRTDRDNHGSLHLHPEEISDAKQFQTKLGDILDQETKSKAKAIWLFLNEANAKYLNLAYSHGFKIHHGKQRQLALYRWLLTSHTDLVPQFSRFYIACGGIIIDDGKLLMVQQANGNRKNDWGIPGGLADMNESIESATKREVLEETNLVVNFKYMVYFRELHNTLFDGTDYYYANYVELDKSSLSGLKLCERELSGYRWVDLKKTQEFMRTHQVRNTQRFLLNYLAELDKEGFDFEKERPNRLTTFDIKVGERTKAFKEHRLIDIDSVRAKKQ